MRRILLATTFLTAFVAGPLPAKADPISLAVAATASAVFGAGGVAAFSFLGLAAGLPSIFASIAVRAALGYALNALTPKASTVSRGYSVNSLGATLPHSVIYGEAKVGGAIFYQALSGTGDRYLHRCIAMAGHEIDSYTTIYFNDEAVTLDGSGNVTAPAQYVGFARVKKLLGTSTQAADSDLVSEVTEWTTAHQAKGIAYLYCRFDFDATAYPSGPPTVTALIKGKKVYDPRTAITAWSENPALCLRDYLTSDYGLNEASSEINDTLFETAANICEEAVGAADRYTCNGAFLLDASPEGIILVLLSSMGGMFWYQEGQWHCRAAAYVTPTLIFDENDLRGNMQSATRISRRDNFNIMRGVYRGPATDYQETDYTEVTKAIYVAEDNGIETATDMPLIFTDTNVMAQRIAEIALKRNREQLTVTAPFGLRAINVKIGDTIMMDNTRAGWNAKVFECVDWRFGLTSDMDLQVNMILREISINVFINDALLMESGDNILTEGNNPILLE